MVNTSKSVVQFFLGSVLTSICSISIAIALSLYTFTFLEPHVLVDTYSFVSEFQLLDPVRVVRNWGTVAQH